MNEPQSHPNTSDALSKVPEATPLFRIVKIAAIILGETGGDALSMSIKLGYVFWTRIPRTVLFWAAFALTRPLGAAVGDYLNRPLSAGGLALSRFSASAVLLAFIAFALFAFRHRASPRAY